MEEQKTTEAPQPPVDVNNATNDAKDAEDNKAMAIIGYILPILFFIPLVTDAKNSPFAKFHANQQLNLLLAAIAVNVVGTIIPILGWFIILPLGTLALFVIAVLGIINAARGEKKALPIIGGFSLIK
ncbi:MAG: hypothetical protein ACD_15C00195G0002 [uncultured bacterium]|nr:MAG: hypothetical protein ACD_15C00195G0002 [uncultured bacterium]HCU70506.1 hypothetical protein [Candidatus Moranbacteria bacterium]